MSYIYYACRGKFSCAVITFNAGVFRLLRLFRGLQLGEEFLNYKMDSTPNRGRYSRVNKYRNVHPFHLVDPSPMPFLTSFAAFFLVCAGVGYMHPELESFGFPEFVLCLIALVVCMALWWIFVVDESRSGFHTVRVQKGLKVGFILFIISEVMFFVGFFWAFFHSSLSPAVELGSIWPPLGIETFDPTTFPLLNTLILLLSGVSVTCAHYYMMVQDVVQTSRAFMVTIALALMFTYVQFDEFYNAPFAISDGVYGSCFFMITGLHGLHVAIGTLFLLVCFLRYGPSPANEEFPSFTTRPFLGFEFASWYWHFVDVVWLYVYTFLYWWGSL